jgi:hypothetical protein
LYIISKIHKTLSKITIISSAEEIGIKKLPENIELEKKYKVKALGIKPFHASKPEFDFLDGVAKFAWENGTKLGIGSFLKL